MSVEMNPAIMINIFADKDETMQDAFKRGVIGLNIKPTAGSIQVVRRSQGKPALRAEFDQAYVAFYWTQAPNGAYCETVTCSGRELAIRIANGGVESFVLEEEYKRI